MSLYDKFFPFKLYNSYWDFFPEDVDDDEEGVIKELKTKEIKVNTTYDEIVNFSKPYINSLFEKYKNYHISGLHSKKTSIKLYISFMENKNSHDLFLYGICFDNIKNEICGAVKFYEKNEELKNESFTIDIMVFLPYSNYEEEEEDDEDSEEEEDDEDSEEEEVLIPKKTTNTINEEVCVVCYAKKPNIIFTDCYHLCVCSKCDEEGKFNKCVLCRVPIKNDKIKI